MSAGPANGRARGARDPFAPVGIQLPGEKCREAPPARVPVGKEFFTRCVNNFQDVGRSDVIVCFKRLGEKKDEPLLNQVCVWATSSSKDVMPGGRMSHVEIMFENEGVWWRFSIVKATRSTGPDGQYVWNPGNVHCRKVVAKEMRNYDYYTVYCPRYYQKRAWHFLHSQVGGDFNTRGYMFNFISPVTISGFRGRDDVLRLLKEKNVPDAYLAAMSGKAGDGEDGDRAATSLAGLPKNSWFCSELVCTALQFMLLKEFEGKVACRMSPNELWRVCRIAFGSHTMNPCIERLFV